MTTLPTIPASQTVFAMSPDNAPVLRAASGSRVRFETCDCFTDQIQTAADTFDNLDWNRINPATGPLFVEGAEPGDTLRVHIRRIELGKQAVLATLPGAGVAGNRLERGRIDIVPVEDDHVVLFGKVRLPLNPMIGVMGVAPSGEPIACGYAGKHGGNMDSKKLTAGSRVYLPVQVEGALLQMGDIHAVMGDCELCGTGLEIGGVITVRVSVLKGRKLDWPVIETADAWHVVSARKDYTSALIDASAQMQELVCAAYGLDPTDAYLYLSLEGDVCINQGCQPCPVEIVLRAQAR